MRPRIVVLYGGDEVHAATSQESAAWLCQHIPKSEFDVTPVYVTADGLWKAPLGTLPKSGNAGRVMDMLQQAHSPISPLHALDRLLQRPIDSIITTMRGRGGDDGSIHSMGEVLHIPVAGSNAKTSSITHNKDHALHAISHIAPTPYSQIIRKKSSLDDIADIVRRQFELPFFVKPLHGAGSHGVTHVRTQEDIPDAIMAIHASLDDILVQEGRLGNELSVTVYKKPNGTIASLTPSVVVPKGASFFHYNIKQNGNHTSFFHDHELGSHAISQAQEIAHAVYESLGCDGIATVDMVLSPHGTFDVLDINTIPTFTNGTAIVHQLRHSGIQPEHLLDCLLP